MFSTKTLLRAVAKAIPGATKTLIYGYYVAPAALDAQIAKDGIPASDDGKVHLFGRRSCALAAKEHRETTDRSLFTIWRADISGLIASLDLDPEAEAISQTTQTPTALRFDLTRGDLDEFCHGYTVSQSIPPDRLAGTIDYCFG